MTPNYCWCGQVIGARARHCRDHYAAALRATYARRQRSTDAVILELMDAGVRPAQLGRFFGISRPAARQLMNRVARRQADLAAELRRAESAA